MTPPRPKVWIGTAGWQYADWDGVFYPGVKPPGFRPLRFISQYFNAVELNSSFYRIPTPQAAAGWARQTPRDFQFSIKLFRGFTHERLTYPSPADAETFREALRPLRDAGVLGPLLVQFPWSFRFTPEAAERICRIAADFPDLRRVIEVRHVSWLTAAAQETLRTHGVICSIDQPVLHDCIGPSATATGRFAYVRLHGRNAANWFRDDQPAFERYNYLYSEAEIREWVQRINALHDAADEIYVIANNHYRAQSAANAAELRALLENRRVDLPPELLNSYPRLASVAAPPRAPTLFD